MKEQIKDQIRENVYIMTDRFANTDFDLQSYQIRESNWLRVDDGKSSDTEFDKLISSLQYNLEMLLSNHNVNPVVYLGGNGNVELSNRIRQ